jgi:hypothetical protein
MPAKTEQLVRRGQRTASLEGNLQFSPCLRESLKSLNPDWHMKTSSFKSYMVTLKEAGCFAPVMGNKN